MNRKQNDRKTAEDEASRQRSHDPRSNARLTALCCLYALAFTGVFACLAVKNTGLLSEKLLWVILTGCALVTVLCWWAFSKFKR